MNEEPPFSGNTVIKLLLLLLLLLEIQRFKPCNFNQATKTTITTFPVCNQLILNTC